MHAHAQNAGFLGNEARPRVNASLREESSRGEGRSCRTRGGRSSRGKKRSSRRRGDRSRRGEAWSSRRYEDRSSQRLGDRSSCRGDRLSCRRERGGEAAATGLGGRLASPSGIGLDVLDASLLGKAGEVDDGERTAGDSAADDAPVDRPSVASIRSSAAASASSSLLISASSSSAATRSGVGLRSARRCIAASLASIATIWASALV